MAKTGSYSVTLISDLESRAILGTRAAVIVDPRGGDVGVSEPLLHLGDVGLKSLTFERLLRHKAAS